MGTPGGLTLVKHSHGIALGACGTTSHTSRKHLDYFLISGEWESSPVHLIYFFIALGQFIDFEAGGRKYSVWCGSQPEFKGKKSISKEVMLVAPKINEKQSENYS